MKENIELTDELFSDNEALSVAKKNFGVKYLFPWQHLVIGNILDSAKNAEEIKKYDENLSDAFCLGKQIVLLPTGAGKSMCFLVPAVLLSGPTLILYPLLALMADQKRRMDDGKISNVMFCGKQSESEREENFKKIKDGAKIIIANPEVLQNEHLLERLSYCNIQHIAIDEAHCVSEWGDSFRPAYLTLGKIIKKIAPPVVTAFTATASSEVLSRVSEVLFDGKAHIVRSECDRPNIHYYVKYAFAKKKAAVELALTEKKPMLIFCGTRHKAEDMSRELQDFFPEGKVKFYHAGLSKTEKDKVEKWFFPEKDGILCTTCAFGMGIDKPDIKTVVHLEPSPTAESYIQEAGRGGRDRSVAKAILLWNYSDSEKYKSMAKNSREHVMADFAESKTCRRKVLLSELGGEDAVCSGCDICDSKEKPILGLEDAMDAKIVLDFIKHNRKLYKKLEIVKPLLFCLNKKYQKVFNMNAWTNEDVTTVFNQLLKSKKIKICGFPWKDRVSIEKNSTRFPKQEFLTQKIHQHFQMQEQQAAELCGAF